VTPEIAGTDVGAVGWMTIVNVEDVPPDDGAGNANEPVGTVVVGGSDKSKGPVVVTVAVAVAEAESGAGVCEMTPGASGENTPPFPLQPTRIRIDTARAATRFISALRFGAHSRAPMRRWRRR
jgi:hypothetical protein